MRLFRRMGWYSISEIFPSGVEGMVVHHSKIHLILGNHDMNHLGQPYMNLFASVSQQRTIRVNGQAIILNHNPFLCFSGAYKGTWQLFGHIHTVPNSQGNGKDDSRLRHLFPTQYDVAVDNNNYKPISDAHVRANILEQIKKSSK